MREHFNIDNPNNYLDKHYLVYRHIKIDIIKFDDWLHNEIGNYEKSKMNMRETLTKHYSLSACKFIEKLL